MIKAKIKDKAYSVDLSNGFIVDGRSLELDISTIGNNTSSIIYNNQSFITEITDIDYVQKSCTVKINGKAVHVEVVDQFDDLLKQLGFDVKSSLKAAELKAPMPGLVLDIFVKEGDKVQKGNNLLVLEAMKMENIIKSPVDLIVKSIKISKGDKVEKNQLLMVLAE